LQDLLYRQSVNEINKRLVKSCKEECIILTDPADFVSRTYAVNGRAAEVIRVEKKTIEKIGQDRAVANN
jgi:hypothetical protein